MSTSRHVIFGAGQVGSHLARMLLERGMRSVSRSGRPLAFPRALRPCWATPPIRHSAAAAAEGATPSITA